MTTIKATCPTCGEVGLTPDEIELRVDQSGDGDSYYAFTCPACQSIVRKAADDRVIRLLISGGVNVHAIEATTAPEPRFPGRPTITHDDILDFHTLLASDGWFDVLLHLTRRQNVS